MTDHPTPTEWFIVETDFAKLGNDWNVATKGGRDTTPLTYAELLTWIVDGQYEYGGAPGPLRIIRCALGEPCADITTRTLLEASILKENPHYSRLPADERLARIAKIVGQHGEPGHFRIDGRAPAMAGE